jgi:hypothetical protein
MIHVTYEVPAVMKIQVVKPCSDVIQYQNFIGPCCLHLYPEDGGSRVLQNIGFLPCHNPEDHNLNLDDLSLIKDHKHIHNVDSDLIIMEHQCSGFTGLKQACYLAWSCIVQCCDISPL